MRLYAANNKGDSLNYHALRLSYRNDCDWYNRIKEAMAAETNQEKYRCKNKSFLM